MDRFTITLECIHVPEDKILVVEGALTGGGTTQRSTRASYVGDYAISTHDFFKVMEPFLERLNEGRKHAETSP